MMVALAAVAAVLPGCGDNHAGSRGAQALVERQLAAFAEELVADMPAADELPARIRAYLEANPAFFGSTVALIGENGKVFTSPYVYRDNGGLGEVDLAYPGYDIDNQAWLTEPRDRRQAVWSEPYFDAGGGNIWMVTRSVPLLRDGQVYAVVTTDLPVDPPPAS